MNWFAAEYRRRSNEASDIRAQLPVFYAWAHLPNVRIIELGVRSGNSTCAFLAGIEHANAGGQLWSVDIAPPAVPDVWQSCEFWHLTVADSVAPEALNACPDAADIVFSDTSHLYDQTLGELRAYLPRVRPGGVLLIHDTDTPGTGDAWPDVPRALDALAAETGLPWYNHPGWNGLGVIEVPAG